MSFLDLLRTLERITRPPRRDEPATTERPDCSCGLGDGVKLREHWSSCAVWDDDQVAKLADMEAEMDRQVGESRPLCACCFERERAQGSCLCDYCTGRGVEEGYYSRHDPIANPAEPDMPIIRTRPWGTGIEDVPGQEPRLTDDELVAVRGLIQERYEGPRPKWLHELLVATGEWAAEMLSGATPSSCGHRYCERQGYGLCFGVLGAQVDFIEDTSLASASVIPTGADAEPDSPAASAPGVSPSEACDIPPSPSEGRSDMACVIVKVLDEHQFWLVNHSSISSADHCRCGYRPRGQRMWQAHVAERISARLQSDDDTKPQK